MQHAFRCKNCGRFHPATGVTSVPTACTVCGKGVVFTESGIKVMQPENWEVLAEATTERLAELGLEPNHVCAHAVNVDQDAADNLARAKAVLEQLNAKEAKWKSRPVADWLADVKALDAEYKAVLSREVAESDIVGIDRKVADLGSLKQRMEDIFNCEWTQRNELHRKHMTEAVESGGHPPNREAKSVFAEVRDGTAIPNAPRRA